MTTDKTGIRETDRIDLAHDYAMCAWARHFNVSERQVREAVAAVGDRAVIVRDHLNRRRLEARATSPISERPSSR